MRRSGTIVTLLLLAVGVAAGQSWNSAYEDALAATRKGEWDKARASFKQAAAYRTEDVSTTTFLPGPASERKKWRNGAPYSPNFSAAYCSYRLAFATNDPPQRSAHFKVAAAEFETLIAKGQLSYETFYFLNACFAALGDTAKRLALDEKFAASAGKITWKVDTEIVSPEELAMIAQTVGGGQPSDPGATTTPVGTGPGGTGTPPAAGTRVPPIATKYALIVGNSESKLEGLGVPFSADDAQVMREALILNAGYLPENVDLVVNATSAQLNASAKALADRLPDGATLFIYFSGVGVNVGGKDYLAGVDTTNPADTSSMTSKTELYEMFMGKGARVFAFFQAHRPISAGRYFGMEVPMVGAIAQTQATMPGQNVYSAVRNGKAVGLFTASITSVLNDLRANRIPILEFGWQVFYSIRNAGTGSLGGSSRQTPTLPVLTNLASDARF